MFNSIWYQNLTKPLFSPPDWLFAPVWMVLYLLMFFALAIYILKEDEDKEIGYTYFIVQLFLNLIWSPIFFICKNILAAFVVIILLDIFVMFTIWKFFIVQKWAGFILLPYLFWILYATYLNFGYLLLSN